tara:strand:- start:69 stop:329 length:261 start_codon:yes stop_codon:yes gene_type:complete
MIETIELNKLSQFKELKKGDLVVVQWHRDVSKNKRARTRFEPYAVVENKEVYTEIILQKSMNVYFNYSMFLDGQSNVKAIILVSAN